MSDAPAPLARCQDCGRILTTVLTICDPCLAAARKVIADIRDYLRQLPDVTREVMGLRAIRYDVSGPASVVDDSRLPFALDVAEDSISVNGPSALRTEAGTLSLLESWVQDWVALSGYSPGGYDTLTYLEAHTLWAAQNHPAWDVYLQEARETRAVVRRLAGLAPEREPAPCVHCGGSIVHEWTVQGLADEAVCTGCGMTWRSRRQLEAVNRWHVATLPKTYPDVVVTLEEARAICPAVKRNTINQVLKRDRAMAVPLAPRIRFWGLDHRGRALYVLADIAALASTAREELAS
ncbi:hypothetical protein ACFWGN_17890 [Oerskovia sp. NPDC060338]|uniref:hypothetical protein n=1 Tax=Oerskovia sp. NPDC060338 TaxID=3347100 RepID=UPI003661D55B